MSASSINNIILKTIKLTKSFNGLTAVNKVDFHIKKGEIVTLIGPNGAGKTVFFNLLTRLYSPSSGDILFGESEISLLKFKPYEIVANRISRTFQHTKLFLNLTVLENVLVGMHTQKTKEKKSVDRAFGLLSFFGERLLKMANEPARALSYANRRRLEIVRALASDPILILLDEPSAGMNPAETIEMMNDIKRIYQMGITILLIEHKMPLVEDVAHRVIVLNHGVKIAEGTFEDVRKNQKVIQAYLGTRIKNA